MAESKVRIRFPAGGKQNANIDVTVDQTDLVLYTNVFPAKEWSLTDDVMNLSDSAAVTIANDNGENSGKITVGQLIIIDESDPDVASGQWIRQFTGRVTAVETNSDVQGGSNIMVTAMDLGWHLTSSHGPPLKNIKSIRFQKLLDLLIDPSWGLAPTETDGDLNTRLKHGRQVIVQDHKPQLGAILPFIQIEPGQSPFDILRTYVQREGLLINVGAKGQLIFFRPNYKNQPLFKVEYHSTKETHGDSEFALIGRPTLRESIDGLYSEVQCWSTVVIPPEIANSENPNEMYRHTTYKPSENPLPFARRHVFSDGEAINPALRKNRATWKFQIDAFNSWEYSCEFPRHSQSGGFFTSNTMISIDDTVNKVPKGDYFIQRVQRSLTLRDGKRTKLTIRKPGLLNPDLQALKIGGGAKNAAKAHKAVK